MAKFVRHCVEIAKELFKMLARGRNVYNVPSEWNALLTMIITNDPATQSTMDFILSDVNHPHYGEVKELKRKFNKIKE